MTIVETACYALAITGAVSLCGAFTALAMASRAADQQRRALVRQLINQK